MAGAGLSHIVLGKTAAVVVVVVVARTPSELCTKAAVAAERHVWLAAPAAEAEERILAELMPPAEGPQLRSHRPLAECIAEVVAAVGTLG